MPVRNIHHSKLSQIIEDMLKKAGGYSRGQHFAQQAQLIGIRDLHHRVRILQVNLCEVTANDALTDHLGAPALLGHLVGVQCF